MASTSSRVEMDKFNGSNFELWKLKMEGMLVDRDLLDVISSMKPQTTLQNDQDKIDKKTTGFIRLYLAN